MAEPIQGYYDKEYHSDYTKSALLTDYSLRSRLNFFQTHCITKNAKVLDYGCGTGAILTGLKNIDKNSSYGVDVSESAIEFAKSKFADYKWKRVAIGDSLPFGDDSFDVVLSSEVIEHVFDVDGYLRELHRVLKPNGILGLSCPFHGFIKDFLILVSGQFEKHFHNPYDPHIRFYSMKSIRRVLTKNAFELIKKKAICPYLGLPFLSRMMAFKAKAVG
jgi:ubiquinone/menaquinone biosynthesis C-methylase UbiE